MNALASRAVTGLLLAGLSLLPALAVAQSTTVRGVVLPDALLAGDTQLTLNGAGVRSKFFFKLYVGSLYLTSATAAAGDANTLVAADEPMAIALDILSGKVTRKRLIDTLEEGFDQSTAGNTAPVQSGIDSLVALMQDDIVPGDRFELGYDPATGTRVKKNGRELAVIEGLPFKQALFGIWLGDKPAQGSLKDAMLGD